jgi:WD40 repeat protein
MQTIDSTPVQDAHNDNQTIYCQFEVYKINLYGAPCIFIFFSLSRFFYSRSVHPTKKMNRELQTLSKLSKARCPGVSVASISSTKLFLVFSRYQFKHQTSSVTMKELFKIDQTYHSNGSVIFKWQPGGNFLATAGANGLVHIFDRHGKQVDEVSLRSSQPVLDLCWDYVGESLAVLQQGNGEVPIWDSTSRNVTMVATNLKNPTFIKWSRRGPQLAVGSEKGNLLIYRKDNRKLIPVAGKHSNKRVTCGAWSNDNKLALGGEDKTMTLSTAEGDTVGQTELAHEPLDIQFAGTHCTSSSNSSRSSNAGGKSGGGIGDLKHVISMNLGGKVIQLYNQENPDDPIELDFKASYGSIVTYKWFGDGQIMIGFSNGYFAAISTNESELGEELFVAKMHKGGLEDVAFCPALQRAATCGERTVRVIDVLTWKEIKSDGITLDRERGKAWDIADMNAWAECLLFSSFFLLTFCSLFSVLCSLLLLLLLLLVLPKPKTKNRCD